MCDPPKALVQPEGAPQKLGLPNRQWAAYSVPPGWVEAGSEWPHPAPPSAADTTENTPSRADQRIRRVRDPRARSAHQPHS